MRLLCTTLRVSRLVLLSSSLFPRRFKALEAVNETRWQGGQNERWSCLPFTVVKKATDDCGTGHQIDQALEERDQVNLRLYRKVAGKYFDCFELEEALSQTPKMTLSASLRIICGLPV